MSLPELRQNFPRHMFPITLRIYSGKDGAEIWTHTSKEPERVQVPGYAGTEHYPVRVRIEFADGTSSEYGME